MGSSIQSVEVEKFNIRTLVKNYLELTKLRIVLLLLFTTVTTMVIAANGIPELSVLIPTLIGGAFAAAGASAINQYIDRDMDALMSRTSRRPIPSGRVAPTNALLFGMGLLAWSVLVLAMWVNWLTAVLALFGGLYYVILYTMILKRNTVVNILIGGGAGAVPVLVGWSAVTGSLSFQAFILFAIVFYWTPPHSWALALLVNKDYTLANVPMMPVAHGEEATRRQILLYSVQLVLITLLPLPFRFLGPVYIVTAALLGIGMLYMAVKLIQKADGAAARAMYKYTTSYLAFLFLVMIVDRLL
ncbi:MAG: heme o synthase [Chloroflexi bacterium]|nr:heme o synthase [Chloroflexota bacterium]MCC6895525.1 protoheme IX farnesyltransferase [Anaerolineae bacterium]